jgi:cell division protease FtsH
MPPRRTWLIFLLIILANYILVRLFFPGADTPVRVPYTLFKEQVANGNVEEIFSQGERITGRFERPVIYPAEQDSLARVEPREVTTFETTLPVFIDPGLEQLLIANGVEISAEPIEQGSIWTTIRTGSRRPDGHRAEQSPPF